MTFPPTQTFPTRISPDDRFEGLVNAAGVRLSNNRMLDGKDNLAEHFTLEQITAPRVVPVRLLQVLGYHEPKSLNDIESLVRIAEWGFAPLSLHAFLAFLGQHQNACRDVSGTTLLDGRRVGDYACVFRFYDRKGFERDLNLFPVRSVKPGYQALPTWTELYAAEPVREDAKAPIFSNPS
jgi:hypothetical protein